VIFVHVLSFQMCINSEVTKMLIMIMFGFFKLINSVLEGYQVKPVILIKVIQLKSLIGHFLFLLKHGKSVMLY
jgi:hypothetical protein